MWSMGMLSELTNKGRTVNGICFYNKPIEFA